MSNARQPAPAAGHDDALASASAPFAGLIALGLSRGFVTRGDVIDALPDDDAHDAGIDAATAVLAELGIAVSDDAHAETDWSLDRYFRPPPLSRAAAERNGAFAAFDLLAPRTTDPVRLYLREMGTVPLLTHDEEIAYAQRIERGRAASVAVLCGDPDALDALASIRREIAEGRAAASAYLMFVDEGRHADAAAAVDPHGDAQHDDMRPGDPHVCDAALARLSSLDALAGDMRAALTSGGTASPAYRAAVHDAAALLRPLRLSARAVERIGAPLRGRARRHREQRARMTRVLHHAGIPSQTTWRCHDAHDDDHARWLAAGIAAHPECERALIRSAPVLFDAREAIAADARASVLPPRTVALLDARLDAIERATHAAKTALFDANLRLVVSIAKRYPDRGLPFADLIQEGNIGLLKAIDRYDHRRGFRFSTYATWWIRQSITHALADLGRTIRVPTHTVDAINKLARLAREHRQRAGAAATPDELAAQMGEPVDKVRELMAIVKEPVSVDLPIAPDGDMTFVDVVPDASTPSPEDAADAAQRRAAIAAAIDRLPPREALIVRLRYGLHAGEGCSLRDIGRRLNLSAERVRQIEASALARLRASDALAVLRPFVG
ncbi:sigma-70 family RNA polymerase sigma factor [Burkholderia multivorans]|uniref:RNA polymerase sigma factor n=2 Tax=Burkholderia multivorans TaxID=87883 RepID=A0AAP2HK68_9BURK|nr:sigma-70 family RNA polymerase sigma factor [Burkholderia multivorans]MBU9357982.1 sigma-70 family RNA polymerase sigma factor [Burkholderia multivorans]MBU9362082.1 sigma-70 family RNA polymerase sigma factor [Burkholderia multivorans]MBU9593909.1 sigma-70 family RNA polymerase sigma factor [Burkholderia multivorans]MCA8454002.1 sigma-70 family RNA polymerase sigma factor [Burkholderia multivorans]MCA8483832.1 sigma-70 family RNA polymerase sigma factor [Burkholderia multivorans]